MTYDWLAALVFLGVLIALTAVGRFLAFRVPALQRMRELNHEADQPKLARKRFREAVRLDPQLTDAWSMIVRIRAAAGDADGARRALDEALDVNPTDINLLSLDLTLR